MDRRFCSMESLSSTDQAFCNRFGRGPQAEIPFPLIHQAFEHIADLCPEEIAIQQDEGTAITYGKLEMRSNALSNKLVALGLVPRQRVCLLFQRSIDMIVAILAVLKAGCQYVPLDGGVVPNTTLSHILHDTAAQFVICQAKFEVKVRSQTRASVAVLVMGKELDRDLGRDSQRPYSTITRDDGAYIIYTSGTTGSPKGVDVSHLGVTNALCLRPSNLNIRVGSKVAQLLSVSFDMAAWEMLGTLMNGGTLVLRGSNWERTLRKVDTIIATPSILGRFNKCDYPNITTIVVGGEPCPQKLADEWAVDTNFWNICGPTEITILNTAHLHTSGQELSIGTPLPNTTVYVLDENESPVTVGEVGIAWVGGFGVSRGYLNLHESTNRRFKLDKFIRDGSNMFNTGDRVRWREDGSLEHHGRIDDQVKFKGFRLELDGISRIIETHPAVEKTCTLVIQDTLWAFFSTSTEVSEQALRDIVAKGLPYYAVPSQWRHLSALPLTSNGKIDKAALRNLATSVPTLPITSFEKDLEKGVIFETTAIPASSSSVLSFEKPFPELPNKNGFHGQRWLRHRFFSLYRRLFSLVVFGNLAALLVILIRSWRSNSQRLGDLANATSINLLVAVLMRQDHIINLLFAIATSVPTWVPLSIRRHLARVYHIGGLHSGCAVAAVLWFLVFTAVATRYFVTTRIDYSISLPALVFTYSILILFMLILVSAHPTIRSKWHNRFEISHRFFGWTALALLWTQTVLVTDSIRGSTPLDRALLINPTFWILAAATASIIYPWLHLRRVNVCPELLSNHAIRLHFDYTNTYPGTAVRISRNPLLEWHAFATIAKPGVKGFSLVVSKAGDWTGETIRQMPTKIWKRGLPACGVLAIAPIFKKIVLVATGSGIGPCLPVIYAKKVPCRIVWSTPHPEQTFGSEIIGAVFDADPEAVIFNTRTQGKPDLVALAYRAFVESGAEAVCIISNKKITGEFVYAMEARGIPAFGAIWDS